VSTIKILADSTCDLNEEIRKQHDIHMIPLNVHFGEAAYKDNVNLTPTAFYDMLKTNPVHPKTSQPTPEDFKTKYSELLSDGSEVISLHISSKMSGTVQSAEMAKKELDSDRIHIVDSEFVTMGLGFMAMECSRARDAGKSAAEILDMVEKLKKEMRLYFIVDTLEYLQKGGRIGKASAIIGGLLNIKPILTIKDGQVTPFEKVRGSSKVFSRMSAIFADACKQTGPADITLGFAHAAGAELLEQLKAKISETFDCSNSLVTEIGPVVGTHAGPGSLLICYYKKPNLK
jgi:DegV family protein with EDD domain